jgi:tetratricopeptide (TPR) repeat protein
MFKKISPWLIASAMMVRAPVFALSPEVTQLQKEWAEIKYKTPKHDQEKKFAVLVKQAADHVMVASKDPEALIWYGIIESSYAGAKGGLGALSHAKNAKKTLEQAIAIGPKALDGSALTSLGSLYYQVPGWPIGFGDDTKAMDYLRQGLSVNPNGIDPNFFYGDFMFRSGDYLAAEQALRKARQAPPRPGRNLADEGRRQEIDQLLAKIADKQR